MRSCFYYRPQRSWAKVMFLQASVILSTGGRGVSGRENPPSRETTLAGRAPPGKENPPPPAGRPPRARRTALPGKENPPSRETPRARRHPPQHTVNERPVRILLECILVLCFFLLGEKYCRNKSENYFYLT